jgi:hypothetical protein
MPAGVSQLFLVLWLFIFPPGFGNGLTDACRNGSLALLGKRSADLRIVSLVRREAIARAEAALGGAKLSESQTDALLRCLSTTPSPSRDWILLAQRELNGVFTGSEQTRLVEAEALQQLSEEGRKHFLGLTAAERRDTDPSLAPPLTFRSPLSPWEQSWLQASQDENQTERLILAFQSFGFTKVPGQAEVERAQRKAEAELRRLGVTFEPVLNDFRGYSWIKSAFQLAQEWKYVRTSSPANDTTLLEIKAAPVPKRRRVSPKMPAVQHPDFIQTLHYLQKNGYQVLVDPSLKLQNKARACYRSSRKFIALNPRSTWESFVHEVEHIRNDLEFWNNGGLERLRELAKDTSPSALEAIAHTNPKLARAIRLASQGFNEKSIDETLAYDAQEQLLMEAGYFSWGSARLNKELSRLHYQIESLEGISGSERTEQQKDLLSRLRQKRSRTFLLGAVMAGGPTLFGTLAAAGGGVYVALCNDESEVLCEPSLVIRKAAREWVYVPWARLFGK